MIDVLMLMLHTLGLGLGQLEEIRSNFRVAVLKSLQPSSFPSEDSGSRRKGCDRYRIETM